MLMTVATLCSRASIMMGLRTGRQECPGTGTRLMLVPSAI